MKQGDELGRDWAETLFEGTFGCLTQEEKVKAQANPELLVASTVERFRSAIEKRRAQS